MFNQSIHGSKYHLGVETQYIMMYRLLLLIKLNAMFIRKLHQVSTELQFQSLFAFLARS